MKSASYAGSANGARSAVQQVTVSDLSGGLRVTDSPLSVGPNECSEAYDVDFPARGGVSSRDSFSYVAGTQTTVSSLHLFERQSASAQVLYVTDSGGTMTLRELSAPSTTISSWSSVSPRCVSVVAGGSLYLFRSHALRPLKWNGTAVSNMNSTTVEGFVTTTTAGGGAASNVPRAKCAAVWQNCLFTANLLDPDGSTVRPNRIRWSWPDDPERTDPTFFEDIDVGVRNDEIVALVPDGERLLVFKRNSVHQIVGSGPNSFSRYEIAGNIGAAGPDAVCRTEDTVYFYDHPSGVYRLGMAGGQVSRNTPVRVSTKIQPALLDPNFMRANRTAFVSVAWDGGEKVYVSASSSEAGTTNLLVESFVYNTVNQAWAKQSIGIVDYIPALPELSLARPVVAASFRYDGIQAVYGGANPGLGAGASDGVFGCYICFGGYRTINDVVSGGPIRFTSTMRLGPVTAGDPARLKRWRKVGLIASPGASLAVQPALDYSNQYSGSIVVTTPGSSTTTWGSFTWGAGSWSSSAARAGFDDARVAGVSRSIEIGIDSTSATSAWTLSAVMIKYIPRQRRDG